MNVHDLIDRVRNAAQVESDRESAVRRFVCPVCGAEPCRPCSNDARIYAHTGRYRLAVEAGAVPPIGGRR